MTKFTYYVEGVGIEVSAIASTQKEAYKLAFASLSDEQKDACQILDCIDQELA